MITKCIVLICGLNIRAVNRLSLNEQKCLLAALAPDVTVAHVGDKGSYCVTTARPPGVAVEMILGALRARCQKLSGAAVAEPSAVGNALAELSNILSAKYGTHFTTEFGVSIGNDLWRAGLALPTFPVVRQTASIPFHETKNAMVFGWAHGAAMVLKREAKNVHWGTAVTDPVERLLRRETGLSVALTSRSANVLCGLVAMA